MLSAEGMVSPLIATAVVLILAATSPLPARSAETLVIEPAPVVAPVRPVEQADESGGMGFVLPPFDLPAIATPDPRLHAPLAVRFDWREQGKVTPIEDQGACGACYAFASLANFESKLLIDGEAAFDFSENNIKECMYGTYKCAGGNFWMVANFLSAKGTVLETCDPYVPWNTACKLGCPMMKTLLDWSQIADDEVPAASLLKAYIQTYGPISAAMNAGHGDAWQSELMSYDGSYTLYYAGAGEPNHAVAIVGWDDALSHAGGEGAWIVKNSWGTAWGGTCGYGLEGGYFTIAYGSAKIGTYSAYISDWQNYDADGSLLYYDERGYTSSVGYGTTTAWGLCKYVPNGDVVIERVEFWTADATTDVDVFVYDSMSGGSLSGLITSKLNSSFALPGYHSVVIAPHPQIAAGNDIYVVVKITDVTYTYPLVYDGYGPKTSQSSYVSATGASWSEWTGGDLGIRLRVGAYSPCGGTGEAPVVETIADRPGDDGGTVSITWLRSTYDQIGSSPLVKRYKVWRRRHEGLASPASMNDPATGPVPDGPYEYGEGGPAWEVVGIVAATGDCRYTFDAPTQCDSGTAGTCWTKFYISAHPRGIGQHFDSAVDSGYSVDNVAFGVDRAGGGPDISPGGDDSGPVVLAAPEAVPGGFRIEFDLSEADWVKLAVYDISGRRVATLVSDFAEAGRHAYVWDGRGAAGSGVASGVYFVRLVTTCEARTTRLAVIR